jgi:hypothetical protein
MTVDTFELVLIFAAVIIGVVSATYLYQSAGIFVSILGRPIKLMSSVMFIIAVGVLLAAVVSYEASNGIQLFLYGLPLQAVFYVFYIIGSVMILLGARKFSYKPKLA